MGTRFRQNSSDMAVRIGNKSNYPVLTTRLKDILQPGMTFASNRNSCWRESGLWELRIVLVTDSGVEKMTLLDENITEL